MKRLCCYLSFHEMKGKNGIQDYQQSKVLRLKPKKKKVKSETKQISALGKESN